MVRWMSRLNRDAARIATALDLRGGTDITGFGLLGHGLEMAEASGVNLLIRAEDVPYLPTARKYAVMGAFAGGSLDNRQFFGPRVEFARPLSEVDEMLLFDAQTSGGLLLPVPPDKLAAFLARAGDIDQPVWVIGDVRDGAGLKVM
jgi:selenide,water dikinase